MPLRGRSGTQELEDTVESSGCCLVPPTAVAASLCSASLVADPSPPIHVGHHATINAGETRRGYAVGWSGGERADLSM